MEYELMIYTWFVWVDFVNVFVSWNYGSMTKTKNEGFSAITCDGMQSHTNNMIGEFGVCDHDIISSLCSIPARKCTIPVTRRPFSLALGFSRNGKNISRKRWITCESQKTRADPNCDWSILMLQSLKSILHTWKRCAMALSKWGPIIWSCRKQNQLLYGNHRAPNCNR